MEGKKSKMTIKMDMTPYGPNISQFNEWIGKNYVQNKKTRVIPYSKYVKIYDFLKDTKSKYCAKFRSWVKQRGFCLLYHDKESDRIIQNPINGDLYVSLQSYQENDTQGRNEEIDSLLRDNLPAISFYRKVAIAEKFYEIIQEAHIDKNGNHAGQKRTYTMVSESYAFLPREAVTYFLLHCATCQPRVEKYGNSSQKTPKKTNEDKLKLNKNQNHQDKIKPLPKEIQRKQQQFNKTIININVENVQPPKLIKIDKVNYESPTHSSSSQSCYDSPPQSPVYNMQTISKPTPPTIPQFPYYLFKERTEAKVENPIKNQFYNRICYSECCPCPYNIYRYKSAELYKRYRYHSLEHDLMEYHKKKYIRQLPHIIDHPRSPYMQRDFYDSNKDSHMFYQLPSCIPPKCSPYYPYMKGDRCLPY